MACIQSSSAGTNIYLHPFHRFGRLADSAETLLTGKEISRIHAIIEWHDNLWTIRDLSKNGVWINGKEIVKNQPTPLQINDKIEFSHAVEHQFTVTSTEQPQDLLIPLDTNNDVQNINLEPIILGAYNLLPNEDNAELLVYYDNASNLWFNESQRNGETTPLNHCEQVYFAQTQWQFLEITKLTNEETVDVRNNPEILTMAFYLSLDEETVELVLENGKEPLNLEIRSHHYLTALLARYKYNDSLKGVEPHLQGWTSVNTLMRDLGYSESHINIQIHRARKHMADKLQGNDLAGPMLIERKKGQVRLNSTHFKLFKGKELELQYN